jgi:hypothetical protein
MVIGDRRKTLREEKDLSQGDTCRVDVAYLALPNLGTARTNSRPAVSLSIGRLCQRWLCDLVELLLSAVPGSIRSPQVVQFLAHLLRHLDWPRTIHPSSRPSARQSRLCRILSLPGQCRNPHSRGLLHSSLAAP